MSKVAVVANVNLPELARGASGMLELTPRVDGLISSGKLTLLRTYQPAAGSVPSGTIRVVLEWVGDSAERARMALDNELSERNPRTTLISTLSELAYEANGSDESQHADEQDLATDAI